MAFDLEGLAQQQSREERQASLLKQYRAARSLKIQAEKEIDIAQKKLRGAEATMAKLLKEAEDELGEEWQAAEKPEESH